MLIPFNGQKKYFQQRLPKELNIHRLKKSISFYHYLIPYTKLTRSIIHLNIKATMKCPEKTLRYVFVICGWQRFTRKNYKILKHKR